MIWIYSNEPKWTRALSKCGVCRMTKHQVADELMALSHNLEIAKHHQVAPLCPYAPLCTVHCAKHPDRRTSPNAPKVLCTMHYTLCTIHYALYTMHYTLCTIHYALCTIH